jgi:hypothetical protein
MKTTSLILIILLGLICIQCNRKDEEEDLYYEPLVEGIYNIDVDQSEELAFYIEPNQPVSVKGQFNNGIHFTIDFPADALKFYEKVEAKISPVSQIQNLPPEFQFNFGFVFSPEGVQFNNPGKMTIELPPGIDINDFKGFYFQGGVPYENSNTEIWSVKLTPVLYESSNGVKHAVIEIPHFSGFLGVSGGEFNCGDPRAADLCEDLKEILACYITGKETLTADDRSRVNNALRTWLNEGLNWLEQNPSEIDEEWEIDYALSELLCWKSTALMFNANLSSFDDILNRAGSLFTEALNEKIVKENTLCINDQNILSQAESYALNFPLLTLVNNLQAADILTENIGIDPINFCNSIATRIYVEPFLDTSQSHITPDHWTIPFYTLTFPKEVDPAVARSLQTGVGFILNGSTLTEEIQTCSKDVNGNTVYYPCYADIGGLIYIILNDSQEAISLTIKRKF